MSKCMATAVMWLKCKAQLNKIRGVYRPIDTYPHYTKGIFFFLAARCLCRTLLHDYLISFFFFKFNFPSLLNLSSPNVPGESRLCCLHTHTHTQSTAVEAVLFSIPSPASQWLFITPQVTPNTAELPPIEGEACLTLTTPGCLWELVQR